MAFMAILLSILPSFLSYDSVKIQITELGPKSPISQVNPTDVTEPVQVSTNSQNQTRFPSIHLFSFKLLHRCCLVFRRSHCPQATIPHRGLPNPQPRSPPPCLHHSTLLVAE